MIFNGYSSMVLNSNAAHDAARLVLSSVRSSGNSMKNIIHMSLFI